MSDNGASLLDARPSELAERLVAGAETVVGGAAACYVVDIAGTSLRRVVGSADLPEVIPLSGGIGPELGREGLDELRRQLDELVPGAVAAPMWLRGRATAALVSVRGSPSDLEALADAAVPAVELAARYTDVFERARRHRPVAAAAEMQQGLLGPRVATVDGGEVAGSLLPAYDIGGDWFEHAENPEGVWMAVVDAMGRGTGAASVASVAVGACRAARRAGGGLEGCCEAIDQALAGLEPRTFATAVLAAWNAGTGVLSWINCGHPPPLLIEAGGAVSELVGEATYPLGLWSDDRGGFERNERKLGAGDRVLIYSDGVVERRKPDGEPIGVDKLVEILGRLGDASASETVNEVERWILELSDDNLSDDATQLVLAVAA